jgi:hypothetical protein
MGGDRAVAAFVTAGDGLLLSVWLPIVLVTAIFVTFNVRSKRQAR